MGSQRKKREFIRNSETQACWNPVLQGPFTVEAFNHLQKCKALDSFNASMHGLTLLQAICTIEYLQRKSTLEMLKGHADIGLISYAEAMLLWLVGCREKHEMESKISSGLFALEDQLSKIAKQRFQTDVNMRAFHEKVESWNQWRWEEKIKMIMKGWGNILVFKERDRLKAELDLL